MTTLTREQYWQQQIDTWQSSGLSQNAYCREHGLRPNQLSYWKRKLAKPIVNHKPAAGEQASAFVPLHISHNAVTGNGLHLRLPNGCELSGIETQHLSIVTRLIAVLR
jgi:hypothetical protein